MELFVVKLEDKEGTGVHALHLSAASRDRLPIRVSLVHATSGETTAYCNVVLCCVPDSNNNNTPAAALRSVVTPQKYRSQGYGRKLVEVAEAVAVLLKLTTVYVSASDADAQKQANAEGFYRHLGYAACQPYTCCGQETTSASASFFSKKLADWSLPPPSETCWTDPEWLSLLLHREVASAEKVVMTATGGLSGIMCRITASLKNECSEGSAGKEPERTTAVLKTVNMQTLGTSVALGLPREAMLYANMRIDLWSLLAPTMYSYGNPEAGLKYILMEDLGAGGWTQLGLLFGGGSPLNWGKDLSGAEKLAASAGESAKTLTLRAYSVAAQMHAAFWGREDLLAVPWLRATQWLQGRDRESWERAVNVGAQNWARVTKKECSVDVKWDPLLVSCMDASFAKASWDGYQSSVASSHNWTLVHGDFHPANFMWHPKRGLVLLDWEVVGVGNGAQDLAQFVISHMDPGLQRETEHAAVEHYLAQLHHLCERARSYTLEQCWADYVAGGAARWVWLLALLATICPSPMVQYFQDQVAAFIRDHGITPETIEMPRV